MSGAPFEYRAIDARGGERRGVVVALSKVEAFRQVASTGLTPVTIRAARSHGRGGRKVRAKDIAHFTYQFSVLISARVPIGDGLLSIAEQEQNPRLAALIRDIASRVEAGGSVADAMEAHVGVLGEVFVESVRAAEKTGNLTKVLEHLSEMLERSEETRARVKSAMMYPICVVAVLMIAVTFLVGFVVPKFARMYESRGIDLPVITRVLVVLGDSVQAFWYGYLIGAVALVLGLRRAWRSDRGRMVIDRVMHRVPYVRTILVGLGVSRFVRVFGLGVSSGVGLIDGLTLAGRACGRGGLAADATRMVNQVRAGGRLADSLSGCQYLTPFCKRMLVAGEDAGELARMCSIVARHYDRETEYLTKNISTVIEPVMVMLIAGVVLLIALAIFLPMWNMVALMG